MEDLKRMSWIFWSAVGGLVICLGGTAYTAVVRHEELKAIEAQVGKIPVPALPSADSAAQAPRMAPVANPNNIPLPAR